MMIPNLCTTILENIRLRGANFINILRAAFTHEDPKSAEKDCQLVSLFCTFGICASCLKKIDEIDTRFPWEYDTAVQKRQLIPQHSQGFNPKTVRIISE
jgi:hypothetical protein